MKYQGVLATSAVPRCQRRFVFFYASTAIQYAKEPNRRRSWNCSSAPGDLGKVIGKQGRTAAALRTLAAAAGEKEGKTVTLEIRDGKPQVNCTRAGWQCGMHPSFLYCAAILRFCDGEEWEDMALVGRIARAHGHPRSGDRQSPKPIFPRIVFSPAPSCSSSAGHGRSADADGGPVSERPAGRSASPASTTMNDAEALAGLELRVPRRVGWRRCRTARSTGTI